MKKPVMVFTIADDKNMPYATMLKNSLSKFHPDWPLYIVSGDDLKDNLKADPQFFYRATPIIAQKYIQDYELVLKIDADSIITGSLDYILKCDDYDIGTVINWNRADAPVYGIVQGWGILPAEYFNCGLVAMRDVDFIRHWKTLCFSPQFERLQYREQDLLNILCYYGNYNVRCFDHMDKIAKMQSWWGLISKGEWMSSYMEGDKIMVPKGKGSTPFPPLDIQLNVLHFAGGASAQKMNYKTRFPDEVVKRLDYLVSDK